MSEREPLVEIAEKVLRTEAEAVGALIGRLDRSFEEAVEAVCRSNGRTVVTGMGKSGIIAKKIAATLSSTGTPAVFLHPAEACHGDLGMVTDEDVIIALSNSGETEEIIRLIPYLKRFGVTLISLTKPGSTLAKASDFVLDTSVREEACPMDIVPTASTTAALAMGDALAVALIKRRGFREEDFAMLHPNGSLGKKLLVKVEDLMHTGDGLPVVCNGESKVAGVITDGDLRRGLQRWGAALFGMKASEVMTRNPRMISRETLAAKALSVMQQHSITSLIVPDEENRPAGVIHLHDILRHGIV